MTPALKTANAEMKRPLAGSSPGIGNSGAIALVRLFSSTFALGLFVPTGGNSLTDQVRLNGL